LNKKGKSIFSISLILVLTLSALLTMMPAVMAQGIDPHPYINAVPNPVQVNNPTLFHVGSVYPTPTSVTGWVGLSVEIVKPDGSTEWITGINTDTTGGTGVVYTPTQVGTYTVRTLFPETVTTFNSGRVGPAGTLIAETYSEALELVVQEDPIAFYPYIDLPSEYWTRPFEHREWGVLGSHHTHSVEPTSSGPHNIVKPIGNEYAPESGHVLWRYQMQVGGTAGGFLGNLGFEQGDAYEEKFHGVLVIGGVLIFNDFEDQYGPYGPEREVVAMDLKTGEELWRRELVAYDGEIDKVDIGQVFYWDSYNYHGAFGYIWTTPGSSWHAFDPYTGRWEYSMENVPSGTNIIGPRGEIYRLSINKNAGTMRLWNSSRVVSNAGSWRPQGEVYNCSEGNPRNGGVEWTINVTGLSDLPGSIYKYRDTFAIGTNFQRGAKVPDGVGDIWLLEYDLFAGTAEIAWQTTWTLPTGVQTVTVEDVSVEQDLIIHSSKETRQTWGRRLSTGALVWGPTPMRHYTDNWGHSSGNSWDIIAEDKVIAGNYGGTVWCYDAQTGDVEWTFDIDDPYTEVLHNNRWRFRPTCATDGKLYIENTEHNPRDPQPRGAPFICLDLETGEEIWRLPYRQGEWSTYAVVADSSIVMQNTYDQSFYVVAKGPSQTTVSANPAVSTHGSNVMVTGSVMDVSPGTQEAKIKLRFPNGVPAVSDESMTDMMTYVYNQYPKPMTTGVTVKVEAWDPNGNYQDLGSVMTDSYGNFGFAFEPEVPGQYYIWATFEGTNGLYGSADSTYIVVDEAPSPATPIEPEEPETPTEPEEPETPTEPEEPETPTEPEEPETPTEPEEPTEPEQPTEAPLITTEVAIILAVAIASIIGIGAFWYLRKR
jgi:hypothetical protein